jgi:aspartyl protease family protein
VNLARLAVFAGIIVALAVLTPKLVPGLVGGVDREPDEVVVEKPPAVAEVEVAVAPRREFPRQVTLASDRRGHFLTAARINGRSVDVMVDTGASIVAIDAETARRLGVSPSKRDFTTTIGTANGDVRVAPVMLREVKVGNIAVRNVEAAVVPGDVLGINLLGMSFLRRLSGFEIADDELVLTQ